VVRYQNHRFELGGRLYMIGTVDASKLVDSDVAKKILTAKHQPMQEA
jgi:hypothetical protein